MTQKRTLKTTKQICSFLELAPTTFYKARKMANLKAYEGTGTRYDPYLYDLLEARVAWTDYQRAIVSRKAKMKGRPKNLGGVNMGDFSTGGGRKPVVLKDVEPDDEPELTDGYTPPVISTKYKDGTDPKKCGSFIERMAQLSDKRHIEESPARKRRKTAVSKNN